jgi:hypothetical protein
MITKVPFAAARLAAASSSRRVKAVCAEDLLRYLSPRQVAYYRTVQGNKAGKEKLYFLGGGDSGVGEDLCE